MEDLLDQENAIGNLLLDMSNWNTDGPEYLTEQIETIRNLEDLM